MAHLNLSDFSFPSILITNLFISQRKNVYTNLGEILHTDNTLSFGLLMGSMWCCRMFLASFGVDEKCARTLFRGNSVSLRRNSSRPRTTTAAVRVLSSWRRTSLNRSYSIILVLLVVVSPTLFLTATKKRKKFTPRIHYWKLKTDQKRKEAACIGHGLWPWIDVVGGYNKRLSRG